MENLNIVTYEEGDIVMTEKFGVGQIITRHNSCYYHEYDIKLLSDVTADLHYVGHKYRPGGYKDEEWFDVIEEKTITSEPYIIAGVKYAGTEYQYKLVKLKVVCVSGYKIHFSFQRQDIDPFLQAKTSGEKLRYILRGLWKDLVIRKVKTVVIKSKPLGVWKYTMDHRGNVDVDHSFRGKEIPGQGINEECTDYDSLYEKSYSHYFGFTFKFGKNDREIYFSKDNYKSIDMDIHMTGWFGNLSNHSGGFTPPLQGQFVCGIVKENQKGLFFDKWFICSDQFVNFWSFIMRDTGKKMTHTGVSEKFINSLVASVEKPNKFSYEEFSDPQKRKTKLEMVHRHLRCFDYHHDTYYGQLIRYVLLNEEPKERNAQKFIRSVGI